MGSAAGMDKGQACAPPATVRKPLTLSGNSCTSTAPPFLPQLCAHLAHKCRHRGPQVRPQHFRLLQHQRHLQGRGRASGAMTGSALLPGCALGSCLLVLMAPCLASSGARPWQCARLPCMPACLTSQLPCHAQTLPTLT